MQKNTKRLLWVLGIVFSCLLLAITIGYAYFYTHKKSILKTITAQLGSNISGDVTIADIDLSLFKNFPSASIVLKDVSIKDSLFASHHLPLLTAKQVLIKIGWSSIFSSKTVVKKIRLNHASVNVFTLANGYTNRYLLTRKNPAASHKSVDTKQPFNLQQLELNDVALSIADAIKLKQYSFAVNHVTAAFERQDTIMTVHVNANVLIKGLGFNLPNGSFATNQLFEGKFDVQFNEKQPELSFQNIQIALSKQPFIFSGTFTFAKAPTFFLQLQTKQIEYNFARSLITPAMAKAVLIVSVQKPFDINATISGSLNSGDPLVNIKWVVKNNILHNRFIDFTNCSFNGYYTNEVVKNLPKKDPNSKVVATSFLGTWQGFVFTAPQIEINNLKTPSIICNLTSQADVTTFNNLLETDAIVAQSGKASLYLNYNGPIENHNTNNTAITGKVSLRYANLLYTPKNIVLANCNGDIVFTENDLAVNNLICDVEGNHIVMQGKATNVLKLVNAAANKINLQWSIYTASLNLQPLKRLFTTNQPVKKITQKKSTSVKASQINNVLTNSNVTLQFKADKLLYQKFHATNVKATILLLENKWFFNNAGLQHAGGTMAINGSLATLSANNIKAYATLVMNNMDVKTVMNSFNNFGLKGISASNLSGKFYTNIVANATLNNALDIYTNTIDATVFFSLKNGTLSNFAPIKAIQKLAFKKRDFSNLAFAELKDSLIIKNETITIKRMEIESSALRMYVEGLYDINGKTTDLSFQIPLSNLKKRDTTYIPTNKGTKTSGGTSIFIRAKPNDNGELKFSYDPFKRFRKSKI
ncbi:MAG: AsmA-like C-terminal region-containing protein [Flavobacterium sp.]|nr:AsmA-like C-terminal region-containing protein [Flavobacterium sp.]